MSQTTNLSDRMRAFAQTKGFGTDHELCVAAEKFDAAARNGDAKQVLGTWARARRIWRQYTGEDYV